MRFFHHARRTFLPAGALTAAALLGVGCSSETLNITDPDVIADGALTGTSGAIALRNGVMQDFAIMFSGTIDGFIVATGNLADEVVTVDTFDDRILPNQRNPTANLPAVDTWYLNMHKVRAGASRAITAWNAAKPTPSAAQKDSLAELYALRGYVENFFSEAFCSGTPFSGEVGGVEVFGEPQTSTEIQQRAIASFDTALANATGSTYRNLAQVGRGRVLLNLGRFADAAAAVAGVPTTFRYQSFHSTATPRQNNGIFNALSVNSSRYNAASAEGTNGIDYLTTPVDPRTPWVASTRVGFDANPFTRNLPTQMKYTALNSAATLADGIEARLIELEARLQGGAQSDRDAVFTGLNSLRTTAITPAMAAMTGTAPTTQAAAVDLFFSERAKWLWLTGHRLGDMRRLVRQYQRPQNTVFPIGPVVQRPGTNYGDAVNFMIPFNETNNPNFKGCIDRSA